LFSEKNYGSFYRSGDDTSWDDPEFVDFYFSDKDKPVIKVGAQYPDVNTFRRALNHYALIKVSLPLKKNRAHFQLDSLC
jgi:hypothetical protein